MKPILCVSLPVALQQGHKDMGGTGPLGVCGILRGSGRTRSEPAVPLPRMACRCVPPSGTGPLAGQGSLPLSSQPVSSWRTPSWAVTLGAGKEPGTEG